MRSLIVKLFTVLSVYIVTGCSGAGDVTIYDATPPSEPASLSAAVTSSTSIDLNWTESTDNVGVAGYRVYRDGILISDSVVTSCTDTGLVSSTTYFYAASAYDAAGNVSALSSAIPVTILELDSPPPSIPTDLHGIAMSSSVIALNWTASTDNVGVVGYRVYRDGILISDSISTSCTDTGLAYSTTYDYAVSAYDATGNMSAQSPIISVTTPIINIAGESANSNCTLLDANGALATGLGANDFIFTSDGTLKTSVAVSGQVSNATLSSTCPFITFTWIVHDMAIYSTGTYTVYTDCPPGSPGCGVGTAITFTVGAGEIGGHMLCDWSTYENMDVINVWQPNAVFAPSPMQTDKCGTNPADSVWRWMSKDFDGDGINGHVIESGDGVPWIVNFNLK
jgi:chitodextrinase